MGLVDIQTDEYSYPSIPFIRCQSSDNGSDNCKKKMRKIAENC